MDRAADINIVTRSDRAAVRDVECARAERTDISNRRADRAAIDGEYGWKGSIRTADIKGTNVGRVGEDCRPGKDVNDTGSANGWREYVIGSSMIKVDTTSALHK